MFPDNAPGNFTDVAGVGVVWTTFNTFQWDLNWANPAVFAAMLEVLLDLANRGIDVLRLDAAPFLWKRLGTNCQNQPEAHLIVQALRALVRIAAPAVAFKAEAIVAPDDLVQYLGAHEHYRPECDLAYHNQLMVMLWSSVATRDARLATVALRRLRPAPPEAGWVTYVRCHDDIGWAVSDADAWAVGWNPFDHRRFLAAYFAGEAPGSFAAGAVFQENPATGDARTSGSTAALCGLQLARSAGDPAAVDAGVRRLVLLYSVAYSFGGVPLVYMGDELGLGGDPDWADDPRQAGDNRWMHRPHLDWDVAERRHDPASVEGRIFAALQRLAAVRRTVPAFGMGGSPSPWTPRMPACSDTCAPTRAGTPSSCWRTSVTRRSARAWTGSRACCGQPVPRAPGEQSAPWSPGSSTARPTLGSATVASGSTAPATPGSPPSPNPRPVSGGRRGRSPERPGPHRGRSGPDRRSTSRSPTPERRRPRTGPARPRPGAARAAASCR